MVEAATRIMAWAGCFVAATDCLRRAGLEVKPIWDAPPAIQIFLAFAWVCAGLRILLPRS